MARPSSPPAAAGCLPFLLQAFIDSYGGDTHQLLTELADVISASVAYVDRPTVEVHLQRPSSDQEWTATAQQFMTMAFDDHVGDAGSIRTDWIHNVLAGPAYPVAATPVRRSPDLRRAWHERHPHLSELRLQRHVLSNALADVHRPRRPAGLALRIDKAPGAATARDHPAVPACPTPP